MIEDRLILTDPPANPTPNPTPNPPPAPPYPPPAPPYPPPAPPANPTPNPTPAPAPPWTAKVWTGARGLASDLLPLVVVLLLAVNAFLLWQSYHPHPGPVPTPAGFKQLGHDFVPALAGALADGFDAAAADYEAGKPVADAIKDLKATSEAKRKAAFAAAVGPALQAIVPEGTEPKDDATRKAFAQAHRDFAAGLRAGR